ncbi:unnamed protein product [Periconia digitata]|uniref:Uncharacterized protein n=1 Tax=Periconia digitata TaxID=1303443 RepID=A0A9W4UQ80_9PLEO|nr:unnamed protein product [Periconia digitata]
MAIEALVTSAVCLTRPVLWSRWGRIGGAWVLDTVVSEPTKPLCYLGALFANQVGDDGVGDGDTPGTRHTSPLRIQERQSCMTLTIQADQLPRGRRTIRNVWMHRAAALAKRQRQTQLTGAPKSTALGHVTPGIEDITPRSPLTKCKHAAMTELGSMEAVSLPGSALTRALRNDDKDRRDGKRKGRGLYSHLTEHRQQIRRIVCVSSSWGLTPLPQMCCDWGRIHIEEALS